MDKKEMSLRYSNPHITLQDVPDEIALALSISGCPQFCEGCHSPELRNPNFGDVLTEKKIKKIISENKGLSCVLFYGGDWSLDSLLKLIYIIRNEGLKVAVYSGKNYLLPKLLTEIDYYKIGEYKSSLGGLKSKTTNQIMFKITREEKGLFLKDITSVFWK